MSTLILDASWSEGREKGPRRRVMNPPSLPCSRVSSDTLADTVLGLAALPVRYQIRMVVKTDEGRPSLLWQSQK